VDRLSSSVARLWQKAERSRAILPIMASICVVGTGNSLLTTAVSLHLSDPGIDPHVVQIVLTAFPVGFFAGCLITRFLVASLGHERSFLLVSLLAALATCGFTMTTLIPVWVCLRLVSGLSMAALFIVSESWINLYADHRNRGRYFSLYMMMTSLAVLFGQLMVEVAGPHSPHLFLIAAVTIVLGLFYCKFIGGRWPSLPVWQLEPDPLTVAPSEQRYGLWRLALLAPVTIVGVFQAGMTNMNVFAMTPIYGGHVGLPAVTAVGLVTAFSIGGMLAQAPIGWLSDRLDRRLILLVQGILAASLCAAIVWAGNRFAPLLFALFFAYGAAALTIYPVAIAFANSQIESRHMVSASGGLLLLYSIGNVMTPGVAADLMERVAPLMLFVMLGSGAAFVAVAASYNLLRRRASLPRSVGSDCIASGISE
jgi:MFS family permease